MVAAIGSSTGSGTGGDTVAQIAALQRQLTALQKQLSTLQKGGDDDATKTQRELLARQITMVQAQITQLQQAAAQKSAMQDVQADAAKSGAAKPSSAGGLSGQFIDTLA